MDYKDKPMAADGEPYIWLRYTTQFTTGGRTHSIEMGIPVPVGASAEMREQLIREAESGMDQLTRRVENRVTQMLQRNNRPQEPARSAHGTIPSTSPAGRPQHAGGAAQAEPQAVPRETSQSSEAPQTTVPLTRQTVGSNMPSTPGIPGDASGNMKLGQFMQFIRDEWGLTPKQAMDLLHLKSLNGLNYRDILRQLQPLVEQQATNAQPSNQKPAVTGQSRSPERPSSPGAPAPAVSSTSTPSRTPVNSVVMPNQKAGPSGQNAGSMTPASPASISTRSSSSSSARPASGPTSLPAETKSASGPKSSTDDRANNSQSAASPSPGPQSQQPAPSRAPVIPIRMVHNEPRKYKFDEEEDEDGDDGLPSIEEEDNDNEQKMAMARIKLDELKEVRGASAANPARLAVLHNVLNSQIDDQQLQRLIQAAWGATTVKKLKVDQVEALISWAKEDYFVEEVGDVLDLLDEEEPYARSDR